MASTWDGNAYNQLCTLQALRNACSLGYYKYTTLPANTTEIATIGDLNTYGITYYNDTATTTVYGTLTGYSSSQCISKNLVDIGAYVYSGTTATACGSASGSLEMVYSSGTSTLFAIGCQLYSNRARTTAKTYGTAGWIYIGAARYLKVSTAGVITDISAC